MCHLPIAAPDCRVSFSRILVDPAEVFCEPGASAASPRVSGGVQGKAGQGVQAPPRPAGLLAHLRT